MSIFRELRDNQVRMICDQISDAGNLRAAAERFDQLVKDKALQPEDRYHIGKKILIEDHNIEVTLFNQVKGAKRGNKNHNSRTHQEQPIRVESLGAPKSISDIMGQMGMFKG